VQELRDVGGDVKLGELGALAVADFVYEIKRVSGTQVADEIRPPSAPRAASATTAGAAGCSA